VFPERRGLIDFTRLMRSGYEEAVAAWLEDWIASNEDDADAFLRAYLKKAVAEDGRIDPAAPGLEDLLNACILAAMEPGRRRPRRGRLTTPAFIPPLPTVDAPVKPQRC